MIPPSAPTDSSADPALTYEQAAKEIGVSARTVMRLVDARRLVAFRIGRSVRIRASEVKRYMDEKEADAKRQKEQLYVYRWYRQE